MIKKYEVVRKMTRDDLLREYRDEINLLNSMQDKSSEVCSISGRIMQIVAEYGYDGIPEVDKR